jgi:pilus assembly protein CpaE
MLPLNAALVVGTEVLRDEVRACLNSVHARVVLEQTSIGRWSEFLVQLGRARPDVLLLDFGDGRQPVEEQLRKIRTVTAAPVVIIHHAADAETILTCLRAGAKEFVYPPVQEMLKRALERISAEGSRDVVRGPAGKVLGFLSAKGGCGATTIACHLAAELHRLTEKEILLADLDTVAGLVGFLMKAKTPYSIADAIENLNRLDLSYWKGLVFSQARLDVITAPAASAVQPAPDPQAVRSVLQFARLNYDWVLADLGRGPGFFPLSLAQELDELYLVTTPEIPALYQAKNIVQTLRDAGVFEDRLRLVVNRSPRHADFGPEEIEKVLGLEIHARLTDSHSELYDAYAEGRLLSPESQLGRQFSRVARGIAGLKEQKTSRAFSLFGLRKVTPEMEGA